jgi:Cu/Ag efflux pump CusA
MWIVRVALDRPYTFIVLALMILILSVVAIARTPTDIFPSIDIPVIAVDWTYTGLNPEELEGRLTSAYEYPGTGSPEAPSASATPLPTGIRDRQPPSLEV